MSDLWYTLVNSMHSAKVDDSQPTIVEALRRIGIWVLPLHRVGQGCPDLLWFHRGKYGLIEIKEHGKTLNGEQRDFHAKCPGPIAVVIGVDQAIEAVLGKEILT